MVLRKSFHRTLSVLLLLSLLMPFDSANANQALATAKSCMACHGVGNRLVGPGFREIAARYSGQPEAVALLAGKITAGSTGVWGAVPMPAQRQVNAAEASVLANWILGLR